MFVWFWMAKDQPCIITNISFQAQSAEWRSVHHFKVDGYADTHTYMTTPFWENKEKSEFRSKILKEIRKDTCVGSNWDEDATLGRERILRRSRWQIAQKGGGRGATVESSKSKVWTFRYYPMDSVSSSTQWILVTTFFTWAALYILAVAEKPPVWGMANV